MRFFKHFFLISLFVVFFISCEEKEIAPAHYMVSQVDPGGFDNRDDFVELEQWMYSELHQTFTSTSYLMLQNLPSMAVKADAEQQAQVLIDTYQWSASDLVFKQVWETFFKALSDINLVIYQLDNFYKGNDAALQLLREARFLRATYIFEIEVMFGDVPVPISPITNVTELAETNSIKGEEKWNSIFEDLNSASLLPKNINDRNRANYWAVQALKGKIYLFRSQKGLSDEFGEAYSAFSKILNSGQFILEKQYGNLFESDRLNEIEPLFYTNANQAQPKLKFSEEALTTFIPTNTFLKLFDRLDLRINSLFEEETSGKQYFKKYNNNSIEGEDVPFYILRLADIWLLHSELLNTILPGDRSRITGLNLVKQRSGEDIIDNSLTYEDFNRELQIEREKELVLEAKSLYDYRRWGIAYIKAIQPGLSITDKHLLFPIPTSVLNDKLLKGYRQNLGY